MNINDELLWDKNQVIVACVPCHERMERDANLTKMIFDGVRGEEDYEN